MPRPQRAASEPAQRAEQTRGRIAPPPAAGGRRRVARELIIASWGVPAVQQPIVLRAKTKPMTIIIREITDDDIDQVVEVWATSRGHGTTP
jgi:hypothetical protein